ncbi:MAG TPA: plastocyanin/azurin family copper-binding protein [Gemmatimonadaceae bacterium]|nr:plastocyanin/azurin family copper-binding protein [Gemmatimonadaceae bacterium]
MPRFSRAALAVLASSVALAACGGGGKSTGPSSVTPPAQATVAATTTATFSPSSVTISPGGTVTFSFGAVTHNVTFTAVAGAPANIDDTSNASVTRTFPTAGTFNFHCTIHPGMTGTVVVASKTTVGSGCGSYSC